MIDTILEIDKNCLFTDNHLVKINEGWVAAKELKVGDEIIDINGKVVSIVEIHKASVDEQIRK